MLRKDAFILYQSLQKVRVHQDNSKFNYVIVKNIKLIEDELKKVQASIEPTQEFIQMEHERVPICEFFSKDADGNVQLIDDEYQINDEDKFAEAMEPLQEKYKECLEYRQKQIDEHNQLLNESIEFNFIKLGKNDLPQKITQEELLEIFPILE